VDPTLLGVNGYNPQTWNRYVYVMNNPLAYTDPLGLWAIDVGLIFELKFRLVDKDDKSYLQLYETKKIIGVEVIAYRTKDTDNGATLADQLGLTGTQAAEFAAEVGDASSFRLSGAVDQLVSSVYTQVERGLLAQANYRGTESGPEGINCGGIACQIGLRDKTSPSFVDPPDADVILDNKFEKLENESELKVGDVIRYATKKGKIPQHFANFIFRSDDGVPIVFSKSGTNGPYQIRSASSLQGVQPGKARADYGQISGYFRLKKKN